MNKVLVKICGITNVEDARWASTYGADYVGLNFCSESPRKVSIDKAAEVAGSLPPFVKSVGVFIDPETKSLGKILKKVPLKLLQLHGDETLEQVREIRSAFNLPVWKALRVKDESSLATITDFAGTADGILLDTYVDDQSGGTGKSFDWNLAKKAKESGIPVILAGGLNPENIEDAVKNVVPFGVDVASGVEKEGHPRKKDIDRMKQFIQKVKSAKL